MQVICPCRELGCTETMHRTRVAEHLGRCPAFVVVCPYAPQGPMIGGSMRWIYSMRARQTVWVERSGQALVRSACGRGCGGGVLQRNSFSQHMLVAHADCEMFAQGCPFASAPEPLSRASIEEVQFQLMPARTLSAQTAQRRPPRRRLPPNQLQRGKCSRSRRQRLLSSTRGRWRRRASDVSDPAIRQTQFGAGTYRAPSPTRVRRAATNERSWSLCSRERDFVASSARPAKGAVAGACLAAAGRCSLCWRSKTCCYGCSRSYCRTASPSSLLSARSEASCVRGAWAPPVALIGRRGAGPCCGGSRGHLALPRVAGAHLALGEDLQGRGTNRVA